MHSNGNLAERAGTDSLKPDALLRRKEVAVALKYNGFPISEKTLATMATRGGGPLYRCFGRIPLYRWADALSWAQGRLSVPRRSTSEGDVPSRNSAGPVTVC